MTWNSPLVVLPEMEQKVVVLVHNRICEAVYKHEMDSKFFLVQTPEPSKYEYFEIVRFYWEKCSINDIDCWIPYPELPNSSQKGDAQ